MIVVADGDYAEEVCASSLADGYTSDKDYGVGIFCEADFFREIGSVTEHLVEFGE